MSPAGPATVDVERLDQQRVQLHVGVEVDGPLFGHTGKATGCGLAFCPVTPDYALARFEAAALHVALGAGELAERLALGCRALADVDERDLPLALHPRFVVMAASLSIPASSRTDKDDLDLAKQILGLWADLRARVKPEGAG